MKLPPLRSFRWWRHLDLTHDGKTFLRRRGIDFGKRAGIYVHLIDGPDPGIDMHDHPWSLATFVLRGGYMELAADTTSLALAAERGLGVHPTVRDWRRWSIHKVPTTHAHRIIHADRGTVTLVARWRRCRTWGFWQPDGWVAWNRYDYATRRPCAAASNRAGEDMMQP